MEYKQDLCKDKLFKKTCGLAKKNGLQCEVYVEGKLGQTNFIPVESTNIVMKCSRRKQS